MFLPHAIRRDPEAPIPASRFCIKPIGLGARMLIDLRALGGLGPGGPLCKGVWTSTEVFNDQHTVLIEGCGYGGSDVMMTKHKLLAAALGWSKPVTIPYSDIVTEFDTQLMDVNQLEELCKVNGGVVEVTDWPGNSIMFPADKPVTGDRDPTQPINSILIVNGWTVSRVSLRSTSPQMVMERHPDSELAHQLRELSKLTDPTHIWFDMMGLRAGSGPRFGWTIRQDLVERAQSELDTQ